MPLSTLPVPKRYLTSPLLAARPGQVDRGAALRAGPRACEWSDGRLLVGVESRLEIGLGLVAAACGSSNSPNGLNRLIWEDGPAAYWPAPFGAIQYSSKPTLKFSR